MIRLVVYIAAIIFFMDQIYVATPPPSIFTPPSEAVSAVLGLPYTSEDLIQLGVGGGLT